MSIDDKQKLNHTEISRWLKMLGEPKRLLLFEALISGLRCNCDLGEALGMAPNLISHHLSVMRESGLIEAEHDLVDGRWIYYSVNPQALESLRQLLFAFFDPARIQPFSSACRPRQLNASTLAADHSDTVNLSFPRVMPKTEV